MNSFQHCNESLSCPATEEWRGVMLDPRPAFASSFCSPSSSVVINVSLVSFTKNIMWTITLSRLSFNRGYRSKDLLLTMQRNIFQWRITKNIEMFSHDSLAVEPANGKIPVVQLKDDRPLVILITWLDAKPKHTKKFVDLYMNKGFNVLNVETFMWHLLWPLGGSQVTASNILEFIHKNQGFQPILVHGLSSGTYVWSEVLVKVAADIEKYEKTIDRVKGQVFDSPPSAPPEFQKAFAKALFPKIPIISYLFEYSLTLYLSICYNVVTKHLVKAYEAAHNPPTKIPSLLFISKNDPIAPLDLNMNMFRCWKENGLAAFMKCWDKSRHIGHYHYHKEEYLDHLNRFLEYIGLNNLSVKNKKEL